MAFGGMLKGAQETAWQRKSWPLQVPSLRHLLDGEPVALNPALHEKRQTVL